MGNVLKAMQQSARNSDAVDPSTVRVVSMAVAEAEQAAREALDADSVVAAPQPPRAPAPTAVMDSAASVIQEEIHPVAEPAAITPLRRSAFFSPLVLTHHRPRCQVSEQIRQTRTALIRIANDGPVRCMITSSQPQEGKTVTATNLAYSFSEITQKRTLLIDADLRRGSVAPLLGMTRKNGLAELLAGECTPEEAIWSAGRESFHVLTAGTVKLDRIGELLSGPRADDVMNMLAAAYDYIVIDSPPVISVADAGILGRWTNMTLLAVRIHKTHRKLVEQATQILESVGVHVSGVIALDSSATGRNYYRYANYA